MPDKLPKNPANNQQPVEPPPLPPDQPSGSFVIPDIQTDVPASTPPVPPPPSSTLPPGIFRTEEVAPAPFSPPMMDNNPSSELNIPPEPVVAPIGDPMNPAELSMPPQETLIIPPASQQNQFIPQGLMPDSNAPSGPPPGTVPPVSAPAGRSFPLKGILLGLLVLVLLVGGFFAVRFGMSYVNNNKPVTIQYWGLWENENIIRPVIADFEAKNPTIKVQYVKQNQQQYRERLQAAIDRGEGPDVFRYHATWIPMLKNEIQPVPTEIMTPSQFTSQFYKVTSQDLLAGSTLWGIPLEVDGLGLYVNDDLFTTAGVTPPTTYEELLSVVPKLTVKNGDDIVTSAIALGTDNNVENYSDILSLMILQNGGKLTDPTGNEAEEALTFYKKFSTPSDPLYTWNGQLDNSIQAFANGRVAMIFAPSWRAFDIKTLNPNINFRIEPVPQLPGNTVTWASYWVEGVSSKSKNQKQAMAFLKYLTSKEAATKLYSEASKVRLFGEPYALKELGSSVSSDPLVGAYIRQADTAKSFPTASNTFDNGLNDQMIHYMGTAIGSVDQGVSITQALGTMSQGFRQVLSTYGLTSSAAAP